MRFNPRQICAVVAMSGVLTMLAGCGGSSSAGVAQTATATSLPTATATATLAPTATATSGMTSFTCPETISGSQKDFYDSQLGLRFSFPATWTENGCERDVEANGTQSVLIGNLFRVITAPRDGLTIQQWVNQQVDTPNETVTLSPLTAPGATSADEVQAAPTSNASKPFDSEPFSQTDAIVAGTQQFYEVVGLIAMVNTTDTAPPLSHDQLTRQVVSTFQVP